MNKPMLAAAVLSAGAFLLHVIAGGLFAHGPLQALDIDPFLRAVAAVVWHFTSLVLALQTLAFYRLSRRPNPDLAWGVIAAQWGMAALFVFYGLTGLGSALALPQWSVFALIGAVGLWGLRAQQDQAD